jgi:hypothetical protein
LDGLGNVELFGTGNNSGKSLKLFPQKVRLLFKSRASSGGTLFVVGVYIFSLGRFGEAFGL